MIFAPFLLVKQTGLIKFCFLPIEIQKKFLGGEYAYAPADGTESWYYKLTDITTTQWGDGWSSFISEIATWDANLSNWNENDDTWDGVFTMSTTQTQLSSDGSDLQFCYIKNTGSTAVIISLDGNSTYPLKLSANASTMFRGYSTNLKINEVYVKTDSSTSTIEYLIAK